MGDTSPITTMQSHKQQNINNFSKQNSLQTSTLKEKLLASSLKLSNTIPINKKETNPLIRRLTVKPIM